MRKVYCYGDSNTYGYDPRSFLGDRYEACDRWPDLIQKETGYIMINDGQNGRELPHSGFEYERLTRRLNEEKPDQILILLGSNDALDLVPAEEIERRLRELLVFLKEAFVNLKILVIAPVTEELGEPLRDALQEQLDPIIKRVCEHENLPYVSANTWDIPLCFDRVHFTEEGHHKFANRLQLELQ